MSARTALAEALTAALPSARYRIVPAADDPGPIGTRTTLLLWQDTVTREEQLGHDRLRVNLVLWILVGHEDPERAEAALEAGLNDVIDTLEPLQAIKWEQAERLSFGSPPTYHGYKLTLTCMAKIGD